MRQILPGAEIEGVVFNIMRYSIADGPGLRTTVFLKGCPLSCRWCHNPEGLSVERQVVFRESRCFGCGECLRCSAEGALGLTEDKRPRILDRALFDAEACVAACPAGAWEAVGQRMSVTGLLAEVLKDRPFFEESGGGITFSGGEPLMQADFLAGILEALKNEEIHTAVDTCGAAPFRTFEKVLPHVDLFLYDIKLMDEHRHERETGVANRSILDNLRALALAGKRIIVRYPLIPGINDDAENVKGMGEFVATLVGVRDIELLPYHAMGVDKLRLLDRGERMPRLEPPSEERIHRIADELRSFGLRVKIRGRGR